MNKKFEYTDDSGDTFAIRELSYGGCFKVSVQCEDDGLPRVVDVPRAALLEWLNEGKPEAQAAQTALVVTDEMAEAACKAAFPKSWEALWGFAGKKNAYEDQRRIITAALAAGRVPVWEPCEWTDIRKGDRYRVEDEYGATESVADIDFVHSDPSADRRYFRIPAPVETAEWPDGEPGDLFRVDYTDQNGERHQDVLMCMNPSRDALWVLEGGLSIHKSCVDDPDNPTTLHKVTRRKDVEA